MLITDKVSLKKYAADHRVWQGIPGITRTKAGRTFVSFYSGNFTETYGNFAAVVMSDLENDFSEPIAVAEKSGDFRCYDPVLWIDPLDRLWFIWNVMPGEEVYASICEDPDANVLKWSEEFYIGRGIMMNKPIVLTSGEWIFPIALWSLDLFSNMRKPALNKDDVAGSYVYKTSDNGKTFTKLGCADVKDRSFDEHMVIELNSGVLMMLVRTKYGIGVSYSYDRGKNWSAGEDSKLNGPCSRFFISRLHSGRILLINHHNFKGRNNLTAMLSEDDGKTFPHKLLLDERDSVSYPDAVQSDDGAIYIVYDRERGAFKPSLEETYDDAREILMAKICEEDIINGSVTSKDSYLKRIVSKLKELSPEAANPFDESEIYDRSLAENIILNNEEDIIGSVFKKYPSNCTNLRNLDAKKLDSLITDYRKSGEKNIEKLTKIIKFIRTYPQAENETITPIVERIKEYIERHFADDFSVATLAEDMQMSVYYLSHQFKSVTGTTIKEYRNELRLTKAKLLLINSQDSIGEITLKTGFCNASYFAEVFVKYEKISPTEYRKYHKRQPSN